MSKGTSKINHNKPFLVASGILTIVILVVGVFLLSKKDSDTKPNLPPPNEYEYYWSQTCPHCANVNEFMNTWTGKDNVQIYKYDINESSSNKQRLLDRGIYCNYPRQELGVPFLVTPDGLCLAGDQPIINHFKSLNLSN